MLLRVAHGEFYTKLKLQRFNLTNDNSCPRCGLAEDLEHKFIECEYVRRIWRCANTFRDKLINGSYGSMEPKKALVGAHKDINLAAMTLTAEVALRISYLKDDQNYLLHPKSVVTNCIKTLIRNERGELKEDLSALLSAT